MNELDISKIENNEERLLHYVALGFTKEAKRDTDSCIRREAYRFLGYTEEAKRDTDNWIRLQAYRTLGYTEEAKQDADYCIIQEAKKVLAIKEKYQSTTTDQVKQQIIDLLNKL